MEDNSNTPLVSICMPLYNAEQYIDETLKELEKQTYKNIEIIIVNDNATDNSLEIARKFESEKIKVFTNPNKGACSARNYAFSKSNGKYIKFMDADDFCTPDLIKKQIEVFKTATIEDIVFSPLKMLFSDGKLILPERTIDREYKEAFDLQIEILKFGGFNIPHCYMMTRELVEDVGGWDENILKNQDGEYFSRVLAKANKAICIKDEFAIWRQTGSGISSQLSLKAVASMLETYRKILKLTVEKQETLLIREICGEYFGMFIYTQYPQLKLILPRVKEILIELNIPVILPGRKVVKVLNIFFDWEKTVSLIYKLNLR